MTIEVGVTSLGWRTLDRRYVHKKSVDGALLERYRFDGDEMLEFSLRTPTNQPPFALDADPADAVAIAEYLRQATIAFAHIYFSVPTNCAFIMKRMRLSTRRTAPVGPLTARVSAHETATRSGSLRSMVSSVEFMSDGTVFATGLGDLQVVGTELYKRLRGYVPAMPDRLPPTHDGPRDAIRVHPTRPGVTEWAVYFDLENPFFFDHEVDHVPGMLLFDAARTVAALALEAPIANVQDFDGTFHRFVNLNEPLRVQVLSIVLTTSETAVVECVVESADAEPVLSAKTTVRLPHSVASRLDQRASVEE